MREIKLRAWVSNPERGEHEKVGYYTDEVIYDGGDWYIHGDYGWSLQELETIGIYIEQFTGIQDSEGVDIYEGDILEGLYVSKGVVKFGDHQTSTDYYSCAAYGWYMKTKNATYTIVESNLFQIIGNIHQHTHLLEE